MGKERAGELGCPVEVFNLVFDGSYVFGGLGVNGTRREMEYVDGYE